MNASSNGGPPGGRLTATEIAIILTIAGILIVVALPGVLRSRMAAREAAAIGALRAVVRAQVSYASVCGKGRYAADFVTLATPAPGSTQPFLEREVIGAGPQAERDGYCYDLTAGNGSTEGPPDCHQTPTHTAYYATATPVSFGSSGQRSFAVNTVGAIWQSPAAAAPAEPFGAPATPIQ